MSSAVGTSDEIARRLRERLQRGLRQIAFWVIPSVVAFFTIGDALIAALYQRGVFSDQSTLYVWMILMGYAVGLLAGTWSRLYSSAFYALNDTRTPLRFALIRVTVAGTLGWLLAFPLRPRVVAFVTEGLGLPVPDLGAADEPVDGLVALGAVGLALASGVASWIEFAFLRRALIRRLGGAPSAPRFHATLWGAAGAAGLAGWSLSSAVAADLHPVLRAMASALAFGTVYLVLVAAFRVPEVASITRRLRR